jgi:hypothetical protein
MILVTCCKGVFSFIRYFSVGGSKHGKMSPYKIADMFRRHSIRKTFFTLNCSITFSNVCTQYAWLVLLRSNKLHLKFVNESGCVQNSSVIRSCGENGVSREFRLCPHFLWICSRTAIDSFAFRSQGVVCQRGTDPPYLVTPVWFIFLFVIIPPYPWHQSKCGTRNFKLSI